MPSVNSFSNSIPNNRVDPPSPDPSRCHAYLKKIAAAVIFVVAGIFLLIPAYTCVALAAPWLLCHFQLIPDDARFDTNNFWDIEIQTCTDYVAAFGWAVFSVPAVPLIILREICFFSKIKDITTDSLPRTLWDEANAELALCK